MKFDQTALDTSFAGVLRHVEAMRARFPNRKSGQGQDEAAGRYVIETLGACGLETELQEFETYDSDIGEAELRLDGPQGPPIAVKPCLHVEPTPPEGITAELVDVGPGAETDYAGKDVRGRIVLAEVSYAPATPEKARIAAAQGAAGIVLMNWGRDDGTEIPWRALKAVWGNPTPESWTQIPRLFGVSISRADGIALRARLKNGPVRLHVRLTASRVWRTLRQPVAWLRAPEGAPERDQFVVVSSHVDAWAPGVTDNITGMSVMMEIARTLARHRDELRRSVVFCCWNGHEVAEAAGSTAFVDRHWEALNRSGVAYVNIDSVGMKGASEFHVASCPELAGFCDTLNRTVFGTTLTSRVTPLRRVGDQSFFGVGVPAVTGRHMYPAAVVAEQHGATLGWYNHTEFDTIEVMDPAVLEGDLDWCGRTIRALLTAPLLPLCFGARLEDLQARCARMLQGGTVPAALERIPAALEALAPEIVWFDDWRTRLDPSHPLAGRANRTALRLARLLTFVTGSASGKYGQDSYGITTLAEPVPLLAALAEWRTLAPDSLRARLLTTELVRRRESLTDALEAARTLLEDVHALAEDPS